MMFERTDLRKDTLSDVEVNKFKEGYFHITLKSFSSFGQSVDVLLLTENQAQILEEELKKSKEKKLLTELITVKESLQGMSLKN